MLVENGSQYRESAAGRPRKDAPLRRTGSRAWAVLVLPLITILALGLLPGTDRSAARATVERETVLMGTRLRSRVTAPTREAAIDEIERVFRIVRRTERLLSTWTPDSELARVNTAPVGRPIRVSEHLFELLQEVRAWSRRTGGAVDPTVGSLVDAWDLRGDGRHPSPAERERARAAAGFGCFALDLRDRTVERRCSAGWIDAGAFGKGEALRRARRALREGPAGSALIDFGGQVLAFGIPAPRTGAPDRGWRVGVADPARRDRPAAFLLLHDRSAATTSLSERFVEIGGERYGHVLDPRDGAPVPDWGSVTVVAGDPLVADLLSTALYVMGPSHGPTWADEREIAALFLFNPPSGLPPETRSSARSPPSACFTEAMKPHLVREDVEIDPERTDTRETPEPKENRTPMEMKPCT